MRVLEILGFGTEARAFRAPLPPENQGNDDIKGMQQKREPDVDPRVIEAIVSSKPKPPTRRRLVDTYTKWISDPLVSPSEGNEAVVNVFRAIVSENTPLSAEKVAEMTGGNKDAVVNLVGKLPFIEVAESNGQKHIDMPDVQEYIGTWKEEAVQKGADREIVDKLLTPAPIKEVTIFESTSSAAD